MLRNPDVPWTFISGFRTLSPNLEIIGEPSRWNTLRALRVLRWWEGEDRQ